MSAFLLLKALSVVGGGLATGAALHAFKEQHYFYAGFLFFTAVANLVILGRF